MINDDEIKCVKRLCRTAAETSMVEKKFLLLTPQNALNLRTLLRT